MCNEADKELRKILIEVYDFAQMHKAVGGLASMEYFDRRVEQVRRLSEREKIVDLRQVAGKGGEVDESNLTSTETLAAVGDKAQELEPKTVLVIDPKLVKGGGRALVDELKELMAEGYKEMAKENLEFVEAVWGKPKPNKDGLSIDEGHIYDADCGQAICCDILPQYLSGESLVHCYQELSVIIQQFAGERVKAQRDLIISRFGQAVKEADIVEVLNKYFPYIGYKDRRNTACYEIVELVAWMSSIRETECLERVFKIIDYIKAVGSYPLVEGQLESMVILHFDISDKEARRIVQALKGGVK